MIKKRGFLGFNVSFFPLSLFLMPSASYFGLVLLKLVKACSFLGLCCVSDHEGVYFFFCTHFSGNIVVFMIVPLCEGKTQMVKIVL